MGEKLIHRIFGIILFIFNKKHKSERVDVATHFPSRSNTPALSIRSPHPNPHPKTTLTIEEWEAKAPVGDAETKSIAAIKTASERRPDLQPSTF